jgi:hypothetical protein
MAEMNDDLFGNLDSKMDFLNEQTKTNTDGIYRIDLSSQKTRKKDTVQWYDSYQILLKKEK